MIDVFEKFAPVYGRVVRKFALDVWKERADVNEFLKKAEFFKKRYAKDLEEHFRKSGLSYSKKRIEELTSRWLADQVTTSRKILTIASLKKGKLAEELAGLDALTRGNLEELVRDRKENPEGRVLPLVPSVSFTANFAARAVQIGEEEAFILGRDLNSDVVSQNADVYRWKSQQDKRVRKTHRILHGKLFDPDHPPTTVDEYGNEHTGNPGTDWGCRCWEEAAKGRPLFGFVARA